MKNLFMGTSREYIESWVLIPDNFKQKTKMKKKLIYFTLHSIKINFLIDFNT